MHFINQKFLIIVARLILGTVMFAQFSLAAQACPLSEPHPTMAFSARVMSTCAIPDHEMNRNACFVHCTSGDQTLDFHHASLNLPVALSVISIIIQPRFNLAPVWMNPPLVLARLGDPPTYLLLQNFRI